MPVAISGELCGVSSEFFGEKLSQDTFDSSRSSDAYMRQ